MMNALLTALLAGAILAGPALAETDSPADPGIERVPYDPMKRHTISTAMDGVVNITVSPRERVIRMTFAQDGIWEGPDPKALASHPLKNNVPLWPKRPGRTTLVLLTEDDEGREHPYYYTLVANDASPVNLASAGDMKAAETQDSTVGVVMIYPEREREDKAAEAHARQQARLASGQAYQVRSLDAKIKANLVENARCEGKNVRYTGQGDKAVLAPVHLCDDGHSTFFHYPGNMHPPGIFLPALDGKDEEWVPTHTAPGGVVVAEMVSGEFHLRAGKAVLYVWNHAFNPIGTDPGNGSGTASPNVTRMLRRTAAP